MNSRHSTIKDVIWRTCTLLLFIGLISCKSLHTVTPPPSTILPTIKPNEIVQLLLTDGTEIQRMKVGIIDSEKLTGTYDTRVSADGAKDQWKTETRTVTIQEIRYIDRTKIYAIKPGDAVSVTLNDGKKFSLKVSTSDNEKIQYQRIKIFNYSAWKDSTGVIRLSETKKIQIEKGSAGKSIGLVTIIIGIVVGAALIVLASQLH